MYTAVYIFTVAELRTRERVQFPVSQALPLVVSFSPPSPSSFFPLPSLLPSPLSLTPQARVNRQQFSSEGTTPFSSEPVKGKRSAHTSSHSSSSFTSNIPLRFSHFASLNSAEVLQAATEDLVRIFQLKVSTHYQHEKFREPQSLGNGLRVLHIVCMYMYTYEH